MFTKPYLLTWVCQGWSLLLLLVTACAATPHDLDVISKIPGYRSDFKTVSKRISEDGKEAVFTLFEPTGIFAFRLDLSGTRFSKVTLVVQKQKFCEGLTFQPDGSQAIELKSLEGVRITQQGDDLSIEFGAAALEKLKPAGRFQFINQYR
ncbi:MAG: hypothetical protein WCH40_02330 [Verrucomicrobiales bacterium]